MPSILNHFRFDGFSPFLPLPLNHRDWNAGQTLGRVRASGGLNGGLRELETGAAVTWIGRAIHQENNP